MLRPSGTPHGDADAYGNDRHDAIVKTADDPVVSDAILPELAQLGSFQRFPKTAGILQNSKPAMQEGQEAPPNLRVQLAQIPHRPWS